ncbi:hypothetical protein CWI61_12745, partial [Neisseria meningitidis]|uniref:hypothetical protein n=1 Tax=Neisseria meningitidis TaxID=487 RepID=UPI000CB5F39C
VLICVIGGFVGGGLSAAPSLVVNHFLTHFPMGISALSVIGAGARSTGNGIAFGFFPAHKTRLFYTSPSPPDKQK